jgi:hypothetical protein
MGANIMSSEDTIHRTVLYSSVGGSNFGHLAAFARLRHLIAYRGLPAEGFEPPTYGLQIENRIRHVGSAPRAKTADDCFD